MIIYKTNSVLNTKYVSCDQSLYCQGLLYIIINKLDLQKHHSFILFVQTAFKMSINQGNQIMVTLIDT